MTIDKKTFDELLPFYVLDAVSGEERAGVDAYLLAHPEAETEVLAAGEIVARLPELVEPVTPDQSIKRALMAKVTADAAAQGPLPAARPPAKRAPSPAPHRSFWDRFWPVFGAAAAAVAVLALIWGADLSNRTNELEGQLALMQETTSSLEGELSALESALADAERVAAEAEDRLDEAVTQNATLREQLQRQQDVLAGYRSPGAVTVPIGDATGTNPPAAGTLTVSANRDGLFVAAGLRPLAANQTYQLWLIDGVTPISAGTFDIDDAGRGSLQLVTLPAQFDAIGVSVEPDGGSETPTMDQIVLLGAAGG